MNPLISLAIGSILRTALPAATAYLAGQGIEVAGASPGMLVFIAIVTYGGAQLWSLARKVWREKFDGPKAA